MIGRTNAGGSDNLNLKVVGGTTQPSNPTENTIWVNTDTEIVGWYIGNYPNPTWEDTTGKVCILATTSTSSTGNVVNVLKKNEILLKLDSVTQYVNGAWERKVAKIYQNGAWVDLHLILYNQGDLRTAITGGWVDTHRTASSYYGYGTFTKGANSITLSSVGPQRALATTYNEIDLTNYTTVKVNITAASSKKDLLYRNFYVAKKSTPLDYAASASITSTGVISMPVGSLTGKYLIGLNVTADTGSNGSITFDKVWCE